MPAQVAWGSSLQFNAKFMQSSVGDIYVPSQANLNLAYTDNSGSTTSDTISMSLLSDGVTWQCVWASTASQVGNVSWNITTTSTLTAASGIVRLTGPV